MTAARILESREVPVLRERSEFRFNDIFPTRYGLSFPDPYELKTNDSLRDLADPGEAPAEETFWKVLCDREVERVSQDSTRFQSTLGYRLRLAKLFSLAGDYEEATNLLATLGSPPSRPSDAVITVMFDNYARAGEYGKGNDLLSPDVCDNNPDLAVRFAERLIVEKRLEEASTCLYRSFQLEPDHWRVNLLLGSVNILNGRYRSAIRFFKNALEIEPRISTAYYWWALAEFIEGRKKRAASLLRRAIALNPKYSKALILFADIALDTTSSLDTAERCLSTAMDYGLSTQPVARRLAAIFIKTKKFSEGISFFEKRKKEIDFEEVENILGVLLWHKGAIRGSARYFARAIDAPTTNLEAKLAALANLQGILIDESRFNEALTLLNIADLLTGSNLTAYKSGQRIECTRGKILVFLGRDEEGLSHIYKLLEDHKLDYEYSSSLYTFLTWYFSVVDVKYAQAESYAMLALRCVESYSRARPNDTAMIFNNLAYIFLETNALVQAKVYLDKAIDISPQDPYVLATQGLYYFRVGKAEKGIQKYREARRRVMNPKIARTLEQKAMLEEVKFYLHNGQFERARRRARKLDIRRVEPVYGKSLAFTSEIERVKGQILQRHRGQS